MTKNLNGSVLWITGLSGAGKTTLSNEAFKRIRDLNRFVVLLDGDQLREVFGSSSFDSFNHTRSTRLALAMQYSYLCKVLADQGVHVVIATISLFKEVHAWNRNNLPGYFEVYLKTPLDELRRRDPKGIYRRFDAGELANVAGLDLPIDEPDEANWVVEFEPNRSVEILADELIQKLNIRKCI